MEAGREEEIDRRLLQKNMERGEESSHILGHSGLTVIGKK